ncbi:unnamed protein product [marine sediment metagenome]|uniref:HU domain-containing protein n=1 Tax=marine sediment metagenome TaxID=412755 RepID=X0WQ43_9ZZZZ
MKKSELDRMVADYLDMSLEDVRAVTTVFVELIGDALVGSGGVQINNLGTFTVGVHEPRPYSLYPGTFKKGERAGKKDGVARPICVHFRRAPRLKRRLKEKHDGQARRR